MNDLRPNKDLLDHNFTGYKLSLVNSPIYKLDLTCAVDCVEPSEDQYSFLHHREFSLHNHLHCDIWDPLNVFFVDETWSIKRVNLNDETGRLDSVTEVLKIPKVERSGGEFNVSICFPSKKYTVIADGATTLHIVEASDRQEANPWKIVFSERVFDEKHPLTLIDSKFTDKGGSFIDCLLLDVDLKVQVEFEAEKKENKNASKYQTVLYWIKFEEVDGQWKKVKMVELRGKGSALYTCIELGCEAVYLVSQEKFKFPGLEPPVSSMEKMEDVASPDYEWEQSFDEIKIRIAGVKAEDCCSVNMQGDKLSIRNGDKILLEGLLFLPVDADLTTWNISNSILEVTLQKKDSQSMWKELIKSDKVSGKVYVGKEVINPEVSEEIHRRLKNLTSDTQDAGGAVINDWQMEECDAFEEESRTLFRFKWGSPEPSHKVGIGGSQWLFNLRLNGEDAPAACIRADVDGCVWVPSHPGESTTWPINHIGTFLAFGYILASKVNRKFTIAPQDLSYVAVVDDTGHIIIYKKGVAVSGSLRNRKTGQKVDSVATQKMINLQIKENVLGAIATTDYIFILMSECIHAIYVKE